MGSKAREKQQKSKKLKGASASHVYTLNVSVFNFAAFTKATSPSSWVALVPGLFAQAVLDL